MSTRVFALREEQGPGYWTAKDLLRQTQNVIDVVEVVYGELCVKEFGMEPEFLFLFDWPMGHQALPDDGLAVNRMNVKYGGKQPHMKSTTVTAEDLGTHDPQLNPGDVQHMTFQPTDPPPLFAPGETDYVGKPKGIKQILLEREKYVNGMTQKNVNPQLCMQTVLGQCSDFLAQKSELQEAIEKRGHKMDMSPKFSCETAGVGIEYSWGRSKLYFRKHCTQQASDLHKRIVAAVSQEVVPLKLVRKYARICRDYMRGYQSGLTGQDLEKMRKTSHCHRSALDSHYSVLQQDHGM